MKQLALLVGVAAIAAVLFWSLRQESVEPGSAAAPVEDVRSATPAEAVEVAPRRADAPVPVDGGLELESGDALAAYAGPRVLLRGSVIDPDGRGVAEIGVTWASVGAWRDGLEAGRLRSDPSGEARGFEAVTDGEGRFTFDVPVPTAAFLILRAKGGPFRTSAQVTFGERAFEEGERELEPLVLYPAGVLVGRVVDTDGEPVAGVAVLPEPREERSFQVRAETDAEGRFELERLSVGERSVRVTEPGWREVVSDTVRVAAGERTELGDLVLERGASISGVVVDRRGTGIAGATVGARPLRGGSTTQTTTGDDGSFAVYLSNDERQRLWAEADGYQPIWSRGFQGPPRDPGTTGVRLRLLELATTRFVVREAATGAPIERFTLSLRGSPGAEERGVTEGPHPGGIVELPTSPGVDTFEVTAPGYASVTDKVKWDADREGVQTIRLPGGGSIRGSLVGGGDGALLTLERGRMVDESARQQSMRIGSTSFSSADVPRRPTAPRFVPFDDFASPDVEVRPDGRFFAGNLRAGLYRLRGTVGKGRFIEASEIEVAAGQAVDLGPLTPVLGGRVEGVVRVLPGDDPAGILVRLGEALEWGRATADPEGRAASCRTAADGSFAFEDLRPGRTRIGTLAVGDRYEASVLQDVDVPAGGTARVEIDLADVATTTLAVRVTYEGRPAPGRWIYVERPSDRTSSGFEPVGVLHTGEDGWARDTVLAQGLANLRLDIAGRRLFVPGASVELLVGEQAVVEVDLRVGDAELPLPDFGERSVRFTAAFFDGPDGTGLRLGEEVWFLGPNVRGGGSRTRVLLEGPPRVRLPALPLGARSYRLTAVDAVEHQNPDAELLHEEVGDLGLGS